MRAKLELEAKDLVELVAMDGEEQERLGEELKTPEATIAARKKDLETEAGADLRQGQSQVNRPSDTEKKTE